MQTQKVEEIKECEKELEELLSINKSLEFNLLEVIGTAEEFELDYYWCGSELLPRNYKGAVSHIKDNTKSSLRKYLLLKEVYKEANGILDEVKIQPYTQEATHKLCKRVGSFWYDEGGNPRDETSTNTKYPLILNKDSDWWLVVKSKTIFEDGLLSSKKELNKIRDRINSLEGDLKMISSLDPLNNDGFWKEDKMKNGRMCGRSWVSKEETKKSLDMAKTECGKIEENIKFFRNYEDYLKHEVEKFKEYCLKEIQKKLESCEARSKNLKKEESERKREDYKITFSS